MKILGSSVLVICMSLASAAFAEESGEEAYLEFSNLEQVVAAQAAVAKEEDLAVRAGAHWDNEEPALPESMTAVYTKPACDCKVGGRLGPLNPFAEFLKAATRRPARRLTCGTFRGEASWYNLPGNRYFNGQRFDGTKNHAAHRTLPMGTVVTVHCPNGRAIDVTIVDDGPHVKGRIIDLVPAPANSCGIRQPGHGPVTLEVKCPVARRGDAPSSPPTARNGGPGTTPPQTLDPEVGETPSLPKTPSIPAPMSLDEEPLT